MRSLRLISRLTLALLAALFFCSVTPAQIETVTNSTSTPTAGSGHDYWRLLSETVNPANGSVSLRIGTPVPPGRKLSVPFSFGYDSNGTFGMHSSAGLASFGPSTTFLSKNGWAYEVPFLTAVEKYKTVRLPNGTTTNCPIDTSYLFQGASGDRHALGIATVYTDTYCPRDDSHLSGGDDFVRASFTNCPGGFCSAVRLADSAGTVFSFSNVFNGGVGGSLPDFIEDRNGNTAVFTNNGNGAFTVTDTVGRAVISSSGFGATGNTISVSGLSSYTVYWGSTPYSLVLNAQAVDPNPTACRGLGDTSGTASVISAIKLPNQKQYTFSYDPASGLISQIFYPTGGWIKYSWSSNPQSEFAQFPDQSGNVSGCTYTYDWPALSHRYVSFDGTTTALQQDFSYTVTWNAARTAWVAKQTTVTTYDLIRGGSFQTVYTYAPVTSTVPPYDFDVYAIQIPVETTVTYKDWNGAALRTSKKAWGNLGNLGETWETWGQTERFLILYDDATHGSYRSG